MEDLNQLALALVDDKVEWMESLDAIHTEFGDAGAREICEPSRIMR